MISSAATCPEGCAVIKIANLIKMFERRKWNNGVCKKTGQRWIFLRHSGGRGPSISWCDRVYSDGLGNLIYIDVFSEINKEYDSNRTPEIEKKEQQFQLEEEKRHKELIIHARNKTGPYAPTRWEKFCDLIEKPFEYLWFGIGGASLCWFLYKWVRSQFFD
jgi:hypothetical protein